jgi:glucokinase
MSASTAILPSNQAVIGIDFGGTKTDIALADGAGNVLERARLATAIDGDADNALRRAAEIAREFSVQAGERHDLQVVAHAAVTPGLPLENGVLLAPNLPGWERLPFARALAGHLGVERVAVANDVRAGALAEARLGALQGIDPAIYVSIGTGLAAALVVGGNVVNGAHGVAGEIGYTSIDLGSTPTAGGAPLEDIVGGRALGQAATLALGEPLDAAALFQRTEPAAAAIIDHAMSLLAGALSNLVLLVDPARIALGGGLMADADRILPVIRTRLTGLGGHTPKPEIVTARFVQDASLYGAITLALESATGRDQPVHTLGASTVSADV